MRIGDIWLIGKGDFFSDTLTTSYSHVYSDFPLLELDARYENYTVIEGYENGKKYLDYEILNDTLFLRMAIPRSAPAEMVIDSNGRMTSSSIQSDTIPAIVDDDYPIRAIFGAKSLQSITLAGEAKLDIPVNPYGSNDDGETVYKPEDWERYVLRQELLNLNFRDQATAELFVESKKINLQLENNIISGGGGSNNIRMIGEIEHLSVLNPQGHWLLNVQDGSILSVDTLIVGSNPQKGSFDSGIIAASCNDYLKADLLYNMDVIYTGDPTIIKSEVDYGRVIDKN